MINDVKNPSISVIVPVYNGEKYLRQSLDSVLNQTFADFELIAVYDESNDRSLEIIEEYKNKDKRVRVLMNPSKGGLASSLNAAMDIAKGKYFARFDCDDINRPYRFQEQFNYLEKHKNVYLLGGGYAPFNENGHRIDIFHPTASMEIAWKFLSNAYFCHPSVIFRREIYKEIGGYPTDKVAEDFDYFSRVVRRYKCANLRKILIDYREHGNNRSFEFRDKVKKSVKKTFLKNFEYYLGKDKKLEADIFYKFQTERNIKFRNLFKILKINFIILNKIKKQYRMSVFEWEFLLFYIKLLFISVASCVGSLKPVSS